MPERQPKAAIDARERRLLRYYAQVWRRVTDLEQQLAEDPKQFRKVRKLREAQREIEAQLDALDARAQVWFSTDFPEIHAMGVNASARELGVPARNVWAAINSDAVSKLATDGFGDLLKATRLTRRTTKALIRTVLEDAILDKLIAGDTAVAAARRASKLIEKKGVHAVRYADGSRHGLREYANMAVRTKTAVAYNLGTLEAADSQGVKHWEIFDGTCGLTFHDGPNANGMIISMETALAYPISHPNAVLAGSTFASYGALEEIVRARYDGPAVRLRAVGAHETTIGPNHPMMTRRGMVRAKHLQPGDEILHDRRVPGALAVGAAPEPDLVEVPFVEDGFETLAACSELTSVPATGDDLHGDGRFCEGDIQVVRPEGSLLPVLDSCGVEQLREGRLVRSDVQAEPFAGAGPGDLRLGGVDLSTASGVRSSGAWGAHFVWVSVVEVERVHFVGWAFDATTKSSLYCSDGFVVSNCRRAFGARPDLDLPVDRGPAGVLVPTAEAREAVKEKTARRVAARAKR